MDSFLLWALVTGLGAGVIAGMLGVGGGILIVPSLLFLFLGHDVAPTIVMQLAVGTSLTTIVVTNTMAVWSQQRRRSVRWDLVWRYTPGVMVGAWIGPQIALLTPSAHLRGLFGFFELLVGLHLIWESRAHLPSRDRGLPTLVHVGLGLVIGFISSLFGIGGGILTVPLLMALAGVAIHQAVGTASAVGLAIALVGAVSYIQAGWHHPDLPAGALGFLLPSAFFGIVAGTLITTPLGVHLAHALPASRLKRFFGLFLLVVGMKLLGAF